MADIPSWFLDWFGSTLGGGSAPTTGSVADVSVAVTTSATTPSVGDTVTITFTATDLGPATATGTTFGVKLPSQFVVGSTAASAGSYDAVAQLWTVGDIASGASDTLTFTGTVQASGLMVAATHLAAVSSLDPLGSDNLAVAVMVGTPAAANGMTPTANYSSDGSNFAPATPGTYNEQIVTSQAAGAVILLQAGYEAAFLAGDNAATLVDLATGNALLTGGAGNCTLMSAASGDTMVGGAGNNFIVSFTGPAVMSAQGQAGNNVFWGGAAAATVYGGSGHDTSVMTNGGVVNTGTGGSQVWLGHGNATVNSHGADTIVAGVGAETVNILSSAGVLVFGGSATDRMLINGGSGAATVVGFGSSVTVHAGSGGGVIFGGSAGHNVLDNGGGGGALIAGGDGDVLTATGNSTVLMAASTGAATLNGAGSSGTTALFGGFGDNLMIGGTGVNAFTDGIGSMTMVGGGSTDLYAFLNGAASKVLIENFNAPNDYIQLQGFAATSGTKLLASMTDSAGGARLNLSDGTQITFANVAKAAFHTSNFL